MRPKLTIGLDYDKTYTADPAFWDSVIRVANYHGHRVLVITARRDTEENRVEVQVPGCRVFFTSLASKLWYSEHYGLDVDIWIDDDPKTVVHGH